MSPSPFSWPAAAAPSGARTWWPTLLGLGFLWLLLLNQQRLEWAVNPVYSYGWAVPVLAGYLFWARWNDRPPVSVGLGFVWFAAGAVLLLAAYLPLRVIQEANPDWVKVNWAMAAAWIGLVLLTLARVGGWRYVRHFFFPLLFCFTALPWPVWMEESLSQNLMSLNASVSAEVLTLMGTPAMAVGNLVQVGENWVNVEEACSGIRSLQTAFMVALFLGEFHRFGLVRRGGLLGASFAVAFFLNLVRTIVLTHFAKTEGGVDRWHDTVGTVAMVACLAALWLVAELMRRRPGAPLAGTVAGPLPALRPFSRLGAVALGLWLVGAEGLTRGWYAWHERTLPPALAWSVRWPRDAAHFAEGKFAERMAALLKFNTGTTASWRTDEGDQWQMYYLQWEPGRVSRFLSSAHYPTVCLPASGMKLVAESGVWNCTVDGREIPFTTYLFDEGGRDVYVFHAVVEDRAMTGGTDLGYRQVSSSDRLGSVARGERNLGQRVLGIALRGPLTPSDARAEITSVLAGVLEISAPAPLPTTLARR